MIDDTPEVRWSSAWWGKWVGGIVLPMLCAGVGAHAFASGKTFAIGHVYRGITLVPVHGFQALLMGFAYAGAALVLFSYYFMRNSQRLNAFYEYVLAFALAATALSLGWCSMIFVTG